MSLHDDERFLAAVAAALGESIGLVRRRGFHLEMVNDDPAPRHINRAARTATSGDDDPIDMATLGIDWDSHDDSRRRRRPLTLPTTRTRRQRRAA